MATALITGGTSGIGAAFARALASRGYDLVLVARDEARLRSVADELHAAAGIDVQIISADLAERADVERVAVRLADADHPIDVFINNAGFAVHHSLLAADTRPHEHAFDVMCRAVLVLGAAAGRAMRARNRGAILNVSSVAGLITMGSYSAIKAWVGSYSEGLAVELRKTDVTVTALLPGWVTTEFHERAGIRTGSIPKSLWIDADRLVAIALRDLDRGRVISIPTVRYQVISWFVRRLPRRTVRWISGAISSSRKDDGSEHSSVGAEQQR
jgi:short-subunit dehydrogenase